MQTNVRRWRRRPVTPPIRRAAAYLNHRLQPSGVPPVEPGRSCDLKALLMARIYLETTIISFYHNVRTEPEMVARQNWTRRWLDAELVGSDELVSSLAVQAELEAGEFPKQREMLELLGRFPLLDLNEAVAEAVDAYIARQVMPNDPAGDALHLAAASFHRCDFLVTWNCRHIANANKFGHIRRVNGILGLGNPALVTPLELLGEETIDGQLQ
jgi:hypothetical protein